MSTEKQFKVGDPVVHRRYEKPGVEVLSYGLVHSLIDINGVESLIVNKLMGGDEICGRLDTFRHMTKVERTKYVK